MRLRIRLHPSVYPGVPYTLTLDAPLVVRLRNTNRWPHSGSGIQALDRDRKEG
jgi:hypothetical protein